MVDLNSKSIELLNFFIYNDTFGLKEGREQEKIFFYYPNDINVDRKIKEVGLSQAIVNFSRIFNKFDQVKCLKTEKTKRYFYSPEPDFWMCLTVALPAVDTVNRENNRGEPETMIDYSDDDVFDGIYQTVLQRSYGFLMYFYGRYWHDVKLPACDITCVFEGIQFLPLDKDTYLRLQSLLLRLEASSLFHNKEDQKDSSNNVISRSLDVPMSLVGINDPPENRAIRKPFACYTLLTYLSFLVCSNLSQQDTHTLYEHVTQSLLSGKKNEEDHLSHSLGATQHNTNHNARFCRFLVGGGASGTPLQKVHLTGPDQTLDRYYLLVYKALDIMLCILLPIELPTPSDEMYKNIDEFLAVRLSSLSSDIKEAIISNRRLYTTEKADLVPHKFVYFNQINLATKTTMHDKFGLLSRDDAQHMKYFCDINDDFQTTGDYCESLIKTRQDTWVFAKKGNEREVYILINQKNFNLAEIYTEVTRICNEQFVNIFFVE